MSRRFSLPLEGGGWNATDLDRRSHLRPRLDRRAKSDGVPGGGDGGARDSVTPTRRATIT